MNACRYVEGRPWGLFLIDTSVCGMWHRYVASCGVWCRASSILQRACGLFPQNHPNGEEGTRVLLLVAIHSFIRSTQSSIILHGVYYMKDREGRP